MSSEPYYRIVKHYEACLSEHGPTARGVDWSTEESAEIRYAVMLDLIGIAATSVSLLDFGCGIGGLKDYIDGRSVRNVHYAGLDISEQFASVAQARHVNTKIFCCDVLSKDCDLPNFDYVVMNGIFTRRHDLSQPAMKAYMERLLQVVYAKCRVGLAFNVMSSSVDWESDALFHCDPGMLTDVISSHLSKHFVIRNDYGLYETTCYVYRSPSHQRNI